MKKIKLKIIISSIMNLVLTTSKIVTGNKCENETLTQKFIKGTPKIDKMYLNDTNTGAESNDTTNNMG